MTEPAAFADIRKSALEYVHAMPGALYDNLMRLPIVGFTLYFIIREFQSLRGAVGRHPSLDGDLSFLLDISARVSLILFLVMLGCFHLSRYRPINKYSAWRPKVVALLGLTLSFLLLLLPRAATVPLVNAAATVLMLGGNALCVFVVLFLGRSLSIMPEARKLIMDGPYRFIRHPLYLAEEIALLGVFLQFRSWEAAAILTVHLFFQLRRIAWEERVLTDTFPEYRSYAQVSYRLIPGIY